MERPLRFELFEDRVLLAIGPPVPDPALTITFTNTETINYDGTEITSPASFPGSAGPVNVVVEALTADYIVNEDEVLVVNAADGVSGGLPGVTLVAGPTHGLLVLDDDGSFILAPDADWFGEDHFLHSRAGVISLTTVEVANVNDAPTAVDDLVQATEDIPLSFDVLANDTDIDGDELGIESYNQPANGVVSHDGSGIFTYTPDTDFFGTDTFQYTASDWNGGSDTATVTIEVAAANDPPVAVPDAYTTRVGKAIQSLAVDGVLSNDVDPDGDVLLGIVVTVEPTHGRLSINEDSGAFLYQPVAGYVGQDSFEYTVSDDSSDSLVSNPAVVTITILDSGQPVVRSDVYLSGPGGITVDGITGVLANDSPVGLTASIVTQPLHGLMVMAADGSFTYTPDTGYAGADPFTYRATTADGLLFDEMQSAIWVSVPPSVLGGGLGGPPPALGGGSIFDTVQFSQNEAQRRAWLDGPILPEGVDAVFTQGV